MARRTRQRNVSGAERFALRRFDIAAELSEKRVYDAREALNRVAASKSESERRNALVDVLEGLMDASYSLGLAEGHLFHAGRTNPLKVPRYKQVAELFSETWAVAPMQRVPNFTDRGRAALAAGMSAAAGAVLGGFLLGPPGAMAGSIAGGAVGPYAFMRDMRTPDDLGDAVLGGGVGGLFTPVGAALGAYWAGDELARAANPRLQSIADALDADERNTLIAIARSRDSEPGVSVPTRYMEEMGLVRARGHITDRGIDVYQRLLPSTRVSNPRRRNGWIGDTKAVEHYLSVIGADKDADGRYLIGGDPPIYGLGGKEMVLSDATVYYADGRPVPLAAGLVETSSGVPVRVFNPWRRPNMDPDAAVEDLNDAIGDENWDHAEQAWEGLIEWVGRGGFMPGTTIELSDDDAYEWMEEGSLTENELDTIHAFNHEVCKTMKGRVV